jgi:hypothetical protein
MSRHYDPMDLPSWHERSYVPGTPYSMHDVMSFEHGCYGEFGHHYWAELHPFYNEELKGYVWLPGVKLYEVPQYMRNDTFADKHGRVFLRTIVDDKAAV